jgi:ribulose-bisphosphate carboxylase small chain
VTAVKETLDVSQNRFLRGMIAALTSDGELEAVLGSVIDLHPERNWEMWGLPMFDLADPAGVLQEINDCRRAYPAHYIRLNAYDAGVHQTTALSFLVQRPAEEPGFRLDREEQGDRRIRYRLHPYVLDRPAGQRYT